MLQLHKALDSKHAILVFRIFFGLAAVALASYAVKTFLVLKAYDIPLGADLWFACVLIICSSIAGILCILLIGRGWVWAIWVWAVVALGLASLGVLIGLNIKFLAQWHVALPWIVLSVSGLLRSRFAMPWKGGSTGRVASGVVSLLIVSWVGIYLIHQEVTAERNEFLDPLKELIATTNQQLPKMVNEELRLDRVSVEFDGYHQYLTFPQYTVAELESDPGLDYVRDYYAEVYASQICEMPICQQRLADGGDCGGRYHHEMVDMNGELVVVFSLDGSDCR